MKRRDFITKGTIGALSAGFVSCSKIGVNRELSPYAFDKKVPKPVGTMPMAEIGKTGIKVSKFGFGSHMRRDIIKFEKEREFMVREAYDLGMNFFDVYDHEQRCYQYGPMGRYLKPMINEVVISISLLPWEDRTLEQELERDLRLFGRDYIDMVRIHAWYKDKPGQLREPWDWWDKVFKFKEQGKIRAVGIPIHNPDHLKEPLAEYPLDYVILPYNFYHNWTFFRNEQNTKKHVKFDNLIKKLREKGVGVIAMKPFAGDNLATAFGSLGAQFDKTGEVNVAKASLKYVINSDLNVDAVIGGMCYPYQVYENIDATFHPEMSEQERKVLMKIRKKAKVVAKNYLQPHYRFLEDWVPDSCDDSDLMGMV